MAISMPKKIDSINGWIDVAARGLAKDAWVRVREETYAHYESARQESLAQGASEVGARGHVPARDRHLGVCPSTSRGHIRTAMPFEPALSSASLANPANLTY